MTRNLALFLTFHKERKPTLLLHAQESKRHRTGPSPQLAIDAYVHDTVEGMLQEASHMALFDAMRLPSSSFLKLCLAYS